MKYWKTTTIQLFIKKNKQNVKILQLATLCQQFYSDLNIVGKKWNLKFSLFSPIISTISGCSSVKTFLSCSSLPLFAVPLLSQLFTQLLKLMSNLSVSFLAIVFSFLSWLFALIELIFARLKLISFWFQIYFVFSLLFLLLKTSDKQVQSVYVILCDTRGNCVPTAGPNWL